MNFSTLKTELSDRGFAFLTDARLGQYINWARAELDDSDLWPYRATTQTGTSPLTVTTLGTIDHVYDTTTLLPLVFSSYDRLRDNYGELATPGTAASYYVTDTQVIAVPVTANAIAVRHWKVPPDLTGTDTPLAPARFHKIIVDIAVREAYRDNDNHQAAEALQTQIDRDVWRMREALLIQSTQNPQDFVRQVEGW